MRIQNNISAMNTHRVMGINNTNMSKSLEKLSSGYRINRAGDDAAGLAISEKMRAQIRGLTMASKNSSDAISLVQTAEGALQSTHDILQRMRELAVQSASDTNEQVIDRGALDQEFQALKAEIDDIASKTRFNDQNLIDGTFAKNIVALSGNLTTGIALGSGLNIRVSATGGAYGTFALTAVANAATLATTTGGTAPGVTLGATVTGSTYVTAITFTPQNSSAFNNNTYRLQVDEQGTDGVIFRIQDSSGNTIASSSTVDLSKWATGANTVNIDGFGSFAFTKTAGATTAQIKAELQNTAMFNNSTIAFDAAGRDAVVTAAKQASVTLTLNGESVDVFLGDTSASFRNSGVTLYFDGGLRDTDLATGGLKTTAGGKSVTVSALSGKALTIQTGANEGDELAININKMNTVSLGISGSTISTRKMASHAITEVNDALNAVSTQRAALGALQNRLEFKISNLDTSAENLQSAESRIRDVDMAKEMMAFTKNNILSQAATAMMAQANAMPQNILQLLR